MLVLSNNRPGMALKVIDPAVTNLLIKIEGSDKTRVMMLNSFMFLSTFLWIFFILE